MAAEIGRLCMKLAGRDAGRECLIIEKLDNTFVMIDGNTRRKRCNLNHLELLPQMAKIKAKASHDEVLKALAELGIPVLEKGKAAPKKKAPAEKPKKAEKKTGILETLIGGKKDTTEKSPTEPKGEKKSEPKKAKKKPAPKKAAAKKKAPTKKPAAKKAPAKKK